MASDLISEHSLDSGGSGGLSPRRPHVPATATPM